MAITEDIANDLAATLAVLLEEALKEVAPVLTGTLRDSIKVIKNGDEYVISMIDYWKHVEYLSNPFVRFTLNTKVNDLLSEAVAIVGAKYG